MEWKSCPHFFDYEVSDTGQVRSLARIVNSGPSMKLGSEQIRAVHSLTEEGWTQGAIGVLLGVDQTTISRVVLGKGTGGVRSLKLVVLKPTVWSPPKAPHLKYHRVGLYHEGRQKHVMVHRLVCEAFHGPPPKGKPTVEHYDGDGLNNNADNLLWASHSEQREGERRRGTLPMGEKHYNAILSDAEVQYVRSVYVSRDSEFGGATLGRKFKVTRHCIGLIVRGLNRKSG